MRGGAESGFTLVEALVALAIFALGLATAFEVSSRTLRAQAAAERHREAVALADWKMNELSTLPPELLLQYREAQAGEVTLSRRRYRWRAIARPEANAPQFWHAAVRIDWEASDFEVETILYRPMRAGIVPGGGS
ncbi:MAG: prepilin-type N-terminal cleavage/methylation domain-containing protein [Gemmatimonadota bacterium]|nr:MAG: prepilin-type N-terminal cleavage/methylation domain-containing protein [Gemmatimonadota bacterium]